MSTRTLEREIVKEAAETLQNPSFKLKDVLEWQTGDGCEAQDDTEKVVWLKKIGVFIAIKRDKDKRKRK